MSPWWSLLVSAALLFAEAHGQAAPWSSELEPEAEVEVEAGTTQTAAPAGTFYPDALPASAHSKPSFWHWGAELAAGPPPNSQGGKADLARTWTNEEGLSLSESLDVLPDGVRFEKTEADPREDAIEDRADSLDDNSPAVKRRPLKGIKSLVIGGVLLVLLSFAMSIELSQYEDELSEGGFGDKLVDSWWAVEDYMDERMPALPIMSLVKMLLLAAAPVLVVSGLLELLVSLKNRSSGNADQSTLLMRGMVLAVLPTFIIALALVALPEYHAENYAEAEEDFEVLTRMGWGVHLVGVAMVIVGAIKARKGRKPQKDSAFYKLLHSTADVDELLKSMPASSSLPGANMKEVVNSEYARWGHH